MKRKALTTGTTIHLLIPEPEGGKLNTQGEGGFFTYLGWTTNMKARLASTNTTMY